MDLGLKILISLALVVLVATVALLKRAVEKWEQTPRPRDDEPL